MQGGERPIAFSPYVSSDAAWVRSHAKTVEPASSANRIDGRSHDHRTDRRGRLEGAARTSRGREAPMPYTATVPSATAAAKKSVQNGAQSMHNTSSEAPTPRSRYREAALASNSGPSAGGK